MLEVGEADEPRLSVGTAPTVARREAIEGQHTHAAAGEVRSGGRAHASRSGHDHVESSHGLSVR
jgi:hypothetical protein